MKDGIMSRKSEGSVQYIINKFHKNNKHAIIPYGNA